MTDTHKEALKPCPFDQCRAFAGSTLDEFYVMCSNDACGGMVSYYETSDEAAKAWNARSPDPLLEEAVGLLRRWRADMPTEALKDITDAFLRRLDAERKGG